MKVRCAVFSILSFIALCSPAFVRAEKMPVDPDLPQPFDASAYLPLIKNPPFTRVVDFSDSLLLTGVAYVEGKPMATLFDKETKKRYVVSEEPNAQGWRLAEATMSNELHGTEIKVQVGEEVIAFRYSESQLHPGKPNPNGPAPAPTGEPGGGHVRTSSYLSAADQEFYKNGLSQQAHDKFRDSMRSHEDKMSKMTDEQRASYAQKVFNKIKAQDQGGQVPEAPKKSKR